MNKWHLGHFLSKLPLEHERRTRGAVPPSRKDKHLRAEDCIKLAQSPSSWENMFSSQVIVNMILSVCSLTQGQPWCSIWGQIWGCPQNFTLYNGSTSGAGDVRGNPKSVLNFRLCSRPCLSHIFSLLPIYPIHLCCNAITLILPGDLPDRELSQPSAGPGIAAHPPQKHLLQVPHHANTVGIHGSHHWFHHLQLTQVISYPLWASHIYNMTRKDALITYFSCTASKIISGGCHSLALRQLAWPSLGYVVKSL